MFSKAGRILAGILLGTLCYVPPVLLLGLFLPQGPGGATGFAIVANILFTAVIVIGVILQIVTTVLLRRAELKYVTAGVWLFYPVVAIALLGLKGYVELRVYIAAQEDHSSRELARPVGDIRDLLLVITPREQDGSGFYGADRCMDACTALLQAGVLNSVAKPSTREHVRDYVFDEGFKVFRHARGDACRLADRNRERNYQFRRANYRALRGLRWKLSQAEIEDAWDPQEEPDRQREFDLEPDERALMDEYLEILASPRTEALAARDLTAHGYFDECITTSFHRSFDYDIRILYGSDLQRPYGPSQQLAEIHAFRQGEPYRVARYEYDRREDFAGSPFTIADIITQLTGRAFDPELPGHPVESVEAELERLAMLLESGAYRSNSRAVAAWVDTVFRTEALQLRRAADGNGQRDVILSAEGTANLIRIAPTDSAELREEFFSKTSTFLDRQTIESIMQAEAQ